MAFQYGESANPGFLRDMFSRFGGASGATGGMAVNGMGGFGGIAPPPQLNMAPIMRAPEPPPRLDFGGRGGFIPPISAPPPPELMSRGVGGFTPAPQQQRPMPNPSPMAAGGGAAPSLVDRIRAIAGITDNPGMATGGVSPMGMEAGMTPKLNMQPVTGKKKNSKINAPAPKSTPPSPNNFSMY